MAKDGTLGAIDLPFQMLPGKLAKHAMSKGTKVVTKFSSM
jgi:hypothetical protein